MKLPNKVRIGYRDYKIKPIPPGGETDGGSGLFNYAGIQIEERAAAPADNADTLLHEILHGCWLHGGLKDSDDEERIVGSLSMQLCQVIRDNPKVVKYLVESLK